MQTCRAEPQDVLIDTVFKYRKNNQIRSCNDAQWKNLRNDPEPGSISQYISGENTRPSHTQIDPATDQWRMFAYLNDGMFGTEESNSFARLEN
jgi:hypothetical protein